MTVKISTVVQIGCKYEPQKDWLIQREGEIWWFDQNRLLRNISKDLTIFHIVAEVLSAEAGPDGGPAVLLCPGQGAAGHGGDGIVWVAEEDSCRETLAV